MVRIAQDMSASCKRYSATGSPSRKRDGAGPARKRHAATLGPAWFVDRLPSIER